MVVIGFVLFVVAAAFGIDLIDKNRYKIPSLHVFGENIGLGGSARLYVLGAITGAVLMLGLMLFIAGVLRKGSKATARRRRRKEANALEREVEGLRTDNASLRERLDSQGHQIDGQGRGIGRRESTSMVETPNEGATAGADT